jgi:hypothetical protein
MGGGCSVVGGCGRLGCAVPTGAFHGFVGAPTPGAFGPGNGGAPPGGINGGIIGVPDGITGPG